MAHSRCISSVPETSSREVTDGNRNNDVVEADDGLHKSQTNLQRGFDIEETSPFHASQSTPLQRRAALHAINDEEDKRVSIPYLSPVQ